MRTRHRERLEMRGRRERYRRRAAPMAPYLLLGTTLLAAALLGIWHNRARAAGLADPVISGVRSLLLPFQLAPVRASAGASDAAESLFRRQDLARENTRLRQENARLRQENEALRTDRAENVRLRDALDFRQKARRTLRAAEVIGVRPSGRFDTLTIAGGANRHVRPATAVRTARGLVGQVSEVSAQTAEVLLLTDVGSGVGAMVVRDGKVKGVGVLEGRGRGQPMELMYLRREDDVRPGDQVVSSGYGDIVPAAIPIGTVESVAQDRTQFVQSARVVPVQPLHLAREVFLIQ